MGATNPPVPPGTGDAPALELRDLSKRYGDVTALDGLDLRVERGAFFGLLGPNGAGNSTTVGVCTTLVRPSSGRAFLLGHDVVADAAVARAAVGLVFQEPSIDPELTPWETLELTARLHHLAAPRRRAADLLDAVGLSSEGHRPARTLSGGQRRRLEIARGLLHRPRVLFLDEPTVGLDPAARAAIWEHLRELPREGRTTVCLTTHSMEEADALCERLAIIDRGRLVVEGAPDALKAALGGDVVYLTLERAEGADAKLRAAPGVRGVADRGEGRIRVTVEAGPRHLAGLVEAVASHGIVEVDMRRPTLEEVFLHHTGHVFETDG